MTRGLFIGRFQPFHLGHLHVVKTALREVDELVIGVALNQEITKENPFSVKERIEMIDLTLPANDIGNYTVFPIPDHPNDDKWLEQIETLVPKFDVVYMSDKDTLGEKWVEKCFKGKHQIKKIKYLKPIDATIIREKMKNNEDWQSLVPKEVVDYISKILVVRKVINIKNL